MDGKESSEDYLEAILVLSGEKKIVRNIDIARHLEFSKPSVTIALRKLKDKGLIDISGDNLITLTEKGQEIAEKTYKRHLGITKVLISLGVDKSTAENGVGSTTFFNRIAFFRASSYRLCYGTGCPASYR